MFECFVTASSSSKALLTSEDVKTFGEGWEVISRYEKRPIVKDYHKCLKTGTRFEERQYETSARLERMTGMLRIVAVRLLQMKFVARHDPDRPAEQLIPKAWLRMLGPCVDDDTRSIPLARSFDRWRCWGAFWVARVMASRVGSRSGAASKTSAVHPRRRRHTTRCG